MTNIKSRKNGDLSECCCCGDPLFVPVSPFIQIGSRWFVIIEWRPDEPVSSRLTLRALSIEEVEWLLPELVNAVADVWGRMFRNNEAIEHGAVLDDADG